MILKEAQPFFCLNGSSELGELVRPKDWSPLPIGAPDQRLQSRCTTVSNLLNSRHQSPVWWEENLTTMYNDTSCTILGEKHPQLLVSSARDAGPEIENNLCLKENSEVDFKHCWRTE